MAKLTNESIILDVDFHLREQLAENFIVQQLRGQFEAEPRYYTFAKHKIDFLIQSGECIISVEVKSSKNVASTSSRAYKQKYSPPLYLRFSALNLMQDGTTLSMPLYLANKVKDLI